MSNNFTSHLSAKLFNVPTVLSTVTAETFAGPFVPEITEGVFPGHEVVDRTSINAWLTPNFVKAVEATGRKRLVIAGLARGHADAQAGDPGRYSSRHCQGTLLDR
jgi:Isochorismatase family